MPKPPAHALMWSAENYGYILYTSDHPPLPIRTDDEEVWQAWLRTHSSFSFQGQHGHFNAFKESRTRGTGYWYAYHAHAGRMKKRYLGRSAALTLTYLEEVALALQKPADTASQASYALRTAQTHNVTVSPSSQTEHKPLLPTVVTKLSPPRLPMTLVGRERLLSALDAALSRPLTLLSASAGWGKTTLLAAWVHRSPQQIAWVSLEPSDNDPTRFWTLLITALRTCLPDIGERALSLLHMSAPLATSLATLLNEVAVRNVEPSPLVLILDDYHVIKEPDIHTSLGFWLEHLPPHLHLVLASRVDPDLPLFRLRVRGHLGEIRDIDLRFTREETSRFLTQSMGLALTEADIALLEAHTEGWIASLHLAALLLQKQDDPSIGVQTLSESRRYLLEYMREEVLKSLPQPLQQFLLQTSGLSRLNASLCDAVTGRSDSDLMLEQILRANLFLQALEGEQQWYRYHHLWSSALQHEARHLLGEAEIDRLAGRESRWYAAHQLLPEAIESAIHARDFTYAAELIARTVTPHSFQNAYPLLRRWLEQLPEEVLKTSPFLSFVYAEALIFTSNRRAPSTKARVELPLRIAEQGFRAQQDDRKLAEVLSIRATLAFFQNDLSSAATLARQMLDIQPEDEHHWRGSSLLALALEALLGGKIEHARQLALEARIAYEADHSIPGFLMTAFLLGEISVGQGELSQAKLYYQQVLSGSDTHTEEYFKHQLITTTGTEDTFFTHQALYGLAQLSYEQNELATAEQWLAPAQENSQVEEMHFLTSGALLQVRILLARGQSDQAQKFLHQLSTQAHSPQFLREIHSYGARIALATGELVRVEEWSRAIPFPDPSLALLRQEEEALLLARLRIAQAKSAEALHLLAPWKAQAQVQQRLRSTLEILLLEALAQFAQGQLPEAKQSLHFVLRRAERERYQRLFLDEGPTVKLLLQTLLPELQEPSLIAYARTLLRAYAQVSGARASHLSTECTLLLEPLSEQEQRVLRLLVAGRTNPEIARELVVSVNTVKTHVQGLYRKLNVHNRTQASEVARRLALL